LPGGRNRPRRNRSPPRRSCTGGGGEVKDYVKFAFFLLCIGGFSSGIVYIIVTGKTPFAACVEAGYRTAMRASGKVYCEKRVNGTDIIVPLEKAQREFAGK
jgi:hypothetical protein